MVDDAVVVHQALNVLRQEAIAALRSEGGVEAAQVANTFPRQALHAATLGFIHPVTETRMRFDSPLPADMAGLKAALGG